MRYILNKKAIFGCCSLFVIFWLILIHKSDTTELEVPITAIDVKHKVYNIVIDGQIFALQRGHPKGISVVWKSLIPELVKQFPAPSKVFYLDPVPDYDYSNELSRVEGIHYVTRSSDIKETIHNHVLNNLVHKQGGQDDPILVYMSTYYDYPVMPDICNIIMYHDLIPENVGMFAGSGSEYWPRIEVLDRISSILSVSYSTSRDIVKWYGPKVTKTKNEPFYGFDDNTIIETVQNRISRDVFPGVATPAQIKSFRQKYGINNASDKPVFKLGDAPIDYLLTVGSAYHYKNTKYIFAGLDRVADQCLEQFTILMVGRDGPDGNELGQVQHHAVVVNDQEVQSSKTDKSQVPIRIKLASYMDLKDLPTAYSGAIGLIYISQYEGFGLPLAEALTSGTLAVAHNCSSLPEVGGIAPIYVQNAQDGDQVAQGIQKLVGMSSHERQSRIKAARKYVERFGGGDTGGIGHGWDEMAYKIAQHIKHGKKHRSNACYTPMWSKQ